MVHAGGALRLAIGTRANAASRATNCYAAVVRRAMKLYPKHNVPEEQAGFTAEEIRKGHHWLNADVKCESCGKVQSLAMAGSTDNGKCIKCGGRTS